MSDAMVYFSGCGLLLIIAVVIGAVLHALFGPGSPSITGGRVVGERLGTRSAEYWHRRESQRRIEELAEAGRPTNAD